MRRVRKLRTGKQANISPFNLTKRRNNEIPIFNERNIITTTIKKTK